MSIDCCLFGEQIHVCLLMQTPMQIFYEYEIIKNPHSNNNIICYIILCDENDPE